MRVKEDGIEGRSFIISVRSRQGTDRAVRTARTAGICCEKLCTVNRATEFLEAIIEPGHRVAIEGDNQKPVDFLAAALAATGKRLIKSLIIKA